MDDEIKYNYKYYDVNSEIEKMLASIYYIKIETRNIYIDDYIKKIKLNQTALTN